MDGPHAGEKERRKCLSLLHVTLTNIQKYKCGCCGPLVKSILTWQFIQTNFKVDHLFTRASFNFTRPLSIRKFEIEKSFGNKGLKGVVFFLLSKTVGHQEGKQPPRTECFVFLSNFDGEDSN